MRVFRKFSALLLAGALTLGCFSSSVIAAEESSADISIASDSFIGIVPGGREILDGIRKEDKVTMWDFITDILPFEEQDGVVTEEGYIKDHLDKDFIEDVTDFAVADVLTLSQIVAVDNGEMASIDDLWYGPYDENGDPTGDNQWQLYSMAETAVPLYDTGESSDYYVAFADFAGRSDDLRLVDVTVGTTDAFGIEVTGCYFDDVTGLFYVPKALRNNEEETRPWFLRMQVFYLIDEEDASTASIDIPVAIVSDESGADVHSGMIKAPIKMDDTWFAFQLVDPDRAFLVNDISLKVSVSGVETENEDVWEYDQKTGGLLIALPALSISSIEIELSDLSQIPMPFAYYISDTLANFANWKHPSETIQFSDDPKVGHTWLSNGYGVYGSLAGSVWPNYDWGGGSESTANSQPGFMHNDDKIYLPYNGNWPSETNGAWIYKAALTGNPSYITSQTASAVHGDPNLGSALWLSWVWQSNTGEETVYDISASGAGLYNNSSAASFGRQDHKLSYKGSVQEAGSVKMSASAKYALWCVHNLSGMFSGMSFGYSEYGTDCFPSNASGVKQQTNMPVQMTVLGVSKINDRSGYVLVACVTHFITNDQAGTGLYAFKYEVTGPKLGQVVLEKGSSNEGVTSSNGSYDYNGVQFRLIDKVTNGRDYNKVATVTNGKAIWDEVPEGEYIITEVSD